MIQRDDMFRLVLEIEPGFQPVWEAFVCAWQAEAELPLYLVLDDLARYLVGRLEAGETASFDALFDVVERWHVEGDDYVRVAATVGLLESLQNLALHRITRPEEFLPWLGPQSRLCWDRLDRFWREGTPMTGGDATR